MKPETTFTKKIESALPTEVYLEKTNNPFRRGTPDLYIEGPTGVHWCEAKWSPTRVGIWHPLTHVSKLQARWLRRSHSNGVSVSVILGCPNPKRQQLPLGLILPGLSWDVETIYPAWVPFSEILAFLNEEVNETANRRPDG